MRTRYSYKGKQYTAAELARLSNISKSTLYARISRGWTAEEAVSIVPRVGQYRGQRGSLYEHTGILCTATELYETVKHTGIKHKTFINRIYRGWSVVDAVNTPMSTGRNNQ